MKKIGIYSGVFDPIHRGHISFAQKAIKELGLDKVYFLVEPKPRHKKNSSDIRHRLNMAWLALREHKDLELLQLDHPTFSVAETLPWLENKFEDAKLHLLIGTDLFETIHTWRGFDQLKDRVNFVVGQREGQDSTGIPIDHQPISSGLADLSSSTARDVTTDELPSVVHDDVASYIQTNNLYSS